jgi:hypothetical protein
MLFLACGEHRASSGDIRQRFVILKNGVGDGQGAETVEPRSKKAETTEVGENRRRQSGANGRASACRQRSDQLTGWPKLSNTSGRKATKMPSRKMVANADETRVAEAEKTARLRALRLAKEAADRDAALHALPPVPISSSTSTRLRSANGTRKSSPRTVP